MTTLWFYLIIFITNIIQGITGFAGTILAMPVSISLVGYSQARPILNGLGLLAGLYIWLRNRRFVQWTIIRQVSITMIGGLIVGLIFKQQLQAYERLPLYGLGVLVLLLSAQGFYRLKHPTTKEISSIQASMLLLSSGVIHALFISGGPLIVGYMGQKMRDKTTFRATLAIIWIGLNSVILIQDLAKGVYTKELWMLQLGSVPFWFFGMMLGSLLYRYMSQRVFMILTYFLLTISGLSIFLP